MGVYCTDIDPVPGRYDVKYRLFVHMQLSFLLLRLSATAGIQFSAFFENSPIIPLFAFCSFIENHSSFYNGGIHYSR